ncbi:class I SAM-dependent methyltransferase [Aestuariivivens sp. NBU2969]|uniref:class I SAM-dependent methyltransferase n=1 Tax=Aestuariivivens sp. NBU2969 TaxID=2873267 RepID=UPI001CBD337D
MEKEKANHVFLKVKDYSVSGEEFKLVKNPEYGFLETIPKPTQVSLSKYYQSEDYISHTDANRNWFEKVYHFIRTITLKRKLRLINNYARESKNLLDIGCGTGDFLQAAKQKGWNVVGIEPNERARKTANKKINSIVYQPEQLSKIEDNSFDVITLWHVLEHLPNLYDQIALFKKLLKPNGTLVIAVPNYKSFDATHYKNFWAAYDVPRHLWHFDTASISNLLSRQSLKVIKIKPMWFDAFYVSLLSEKYKSGKMNIIKGFCVGLSSNLKSLATKEASSLIYVAKNNQNLV